MREARAADAAAYSGFVTRLREALKQRSEQVLCWYPAAQGYMADIPGGRLLLAILPEYSSLTMIYETRGADGTVERGQRLLSYGKPDKLQRRALELATRGVPGGPTFTGEGWTWDRVSEDGSRRMPVPAGELRISRPDGGIAMLTHDDDSGVELLAIDGEAVLEGQALMWWQHRTERPLRVVMDGQEAKLRSLDVPGLIGYHSVTDEILVALARDGEELALLLVEGLYVRLAAKVTWEEAIAGGPFNVDGLLLMMERGVANHGPAANARAEVPAAGFEGQTRVTPSPQTSPVAGVPVPPATCPPGCMPMAEPHRRLCERYFKGLCRRLRGRGARKARELVRLILARIDGCRSDITGTRQEVHRELERLLERALAGGDRNIRDALDLLVKQALFVEREEGTRCTVLFSQLHDPGSEVMRRIAAEMAPATPPPIVDASEDHGAAPGKGEPEGVRTTTVAEVSVLVEVPSTGAVVASDVALADTSEVVADSPGSAVETIDGSSAATHRHGLDAVAGVAGHESSSALRVPAATTPPAGSPPSVHVYQALARKVEEPPVRMIPSTERREFRDAPIIPAKAAKPREPEAPLRGFTRSTPAPGEAPEPEDEQPRGPGRGKWSDDQGPP